MLCANCNGHDPQAKGTQTCRAAGADFVRLTIATESFGMPPAMHTPLSPHRSATAGGRSLWLFATLWSLRQYPTQRREWSRAKKFSAIRAAGFDGVFSPPLPWLAERGDLRYLAVTSLDSAAQVEKPIREAKTLGAVAIDVQLCDYDTPIPAAIKVALRIRDVARDCGLPFAIETHRDTITETPEKTLALAKAYRAIAKETMPCCLDHSHFAVVRHLTPGRFWEYLREPERLLRAATQFHLRPFNGHHCQIPVLSPSGRRTPEYQDWLVYAASLLRNLRAQPRNDPVLAVPELGHAAPSYGLSCFPDTWRDTTTVGRDLRRIWKESAIAEA